MKASIFIVCVFVIVACHAQCPATAPSSGPCTFPTDAVCTAQGGTCDLLDGCCVNPLTATTVATTVAGTATTSSTGTGALGPCFDNECPTGFTCNTDLQLCFTTGCIGACFDNACPTGYTCNTTSQLCCSSTTATTASTTTCRDLIGPRGYSDCPARASLCNSTVYYDLMTQQCPRTCNRCTTASASTVSTTCVDLTRANGTSDCPQIAYLCNNTIYSTLMTQQCPRTCGRCTTG